MSSLTVQIAILDAAVDSLMGLRSTLTTAADDVGAAVRGLAVAAPDSALATDLPAVPLDHLVEVIASRCQHMAARVGDAAEGYRRLEAALLGEFQRAGGPVAVPR